MPLGYPEPPLRLTEVRYQSWIVAMVFNRLAWRTGGMAVENRRHRPACREGKVCLGLVRHSGGCAFAHASLQAPGPARNARQSLRIDATEDQLEGADYLYRAMTLNVSVKEHIRTGEIREARLTGVVKPLWEVDDGKLEALWRKGKKAWAGISSPTEWVEQLRAPGSRFKLLGHHLT